MHARLGLYRGLKNTAVLRLLGESYQRVYHRGVEHGWLKGRYLVRDLSLNRYAQDARPLKYQTRSEEHTSELQSRPHLVCRLLLEKKNDRVRRELAACHSLRPQLALRHPVDPRPDWHANWVLANQKTVRQFCRKLHADRPPTAILE